MECTRIEAFLTRETDEEKVSKIIVAYGKRYHLSRIENIGRMGGIAVYYPEESEKCQKP